MVDGFHAGIKFSISKNNLTLEEVSLVILLVSEITILIWWKVVKKSGKIEIWLSALLPWEGKGVG